MSLASPSLRLEDQIGAEQFEQLMAMFRTRRGRMSGSIKLSTTDFRRALAQLMGRKEADEKVALLSEKVDRNGAGYVDCDAFCSYILQQLKERDSTAQMRPVPFQDYPKFKHNSYSKETICRVMPVSNPPRSITVSKDATIATWSPSLQLQRGMSARTDFQASRRVPRGKRSSVWITDCALMSDSYRLVLATTSRELLFYDLSTATYKLQYRLYDLPCVVLCLHYHCNSESGSCYSHLAYGDELGSVVLLTFLQPLKDLFASISSSDSEATQLIAFGRLAEHSSQVTVHCFPQLHPDWVRQVEYVAHSSSVLSCSNTPSQSLVLRDVDDKKKSYIFRIRKGVMCFSYSHSLDLIATGSIDHMVRLWNPYVPTKAVGVLAGHSTTVLDTLIHREKGLVYSLSQDLVLFVWDIFDHAAIQTLSLKFPFTQRLPDFGPSILSLDSSHTLTITCNDYVAMLKLGNTTMVAGTGLAVTHCLPITASLYNHHFRQVVSGCEGGGVSIWEVDGGKRVLHLANCHGNQELTAIALDSTGRRLLTGARNGDIKVWDYLSGDCLKVLSGATVATEVTAMLHMLDRSQFLSVGWNGRIITFMDKADTFNVKPSIHWQGEDHHKDDILCMAYCPPDYLATGSFDGELVVWSVDMEREVSRFQSMAKIKQTLLRSLKKASAVPSRSSLSTPSRPVSRRLSAYRLKANSLCLYHVPVDQVVFLRSRARAHCPGSAILVSSEDGHARFWDIFSGKDPAGSFPLTELEDENVLALCTDSGDHHLLAGDTAGFISLFDIHHYCSTTAEDSTIPEPIIRLKAHSSEIVSIQCVEHTSQPLILSAGDCTVRLWTMQGHYVGTFGQDQPWEISTPTTFKHPDTPWEEIQRTLSSLSHSCLSSDIDEVSETQGQKRLGNELDKRPGSRLHSEMARQVEVIREEEEETDGKENLSVRFGGEDNLQSLDGEHSCLHGRWNRIIPALVDECTLGATYKAGMQRRMEGRLERREHYSGVDLKSMERIGSVCSPFQALHLLSIDADLPANEPTTVMIKSD